MSRHNLHGDIPQEHRDLIEELLKIEDNVDGNTKLEPAIIAKSMICMAHDWYAMGDEDKGATLLEKAEKAYPGYFDHKIKEHTDADTAYRELVDRLGLIILRTLKSISEGARGN